MISMYRFQYKENLTQRLQKPAHVVPVFKEQVMQGQEGIVAKISNTEIRGQIQNCCNLTEYYWVIWKDLPKNQ
jgi:hypothetical protein